MKIRPDFRFFLLHIPYRLVHSLLLTVIVFIFVFVAGAIYADLTRSYDSTIRTGTYIILASYILIFALEVLGDYLYMRGSYLRSTDDGIEYCEDGFSRDKGNWPYASITGTEAVQTLSGRLFGLSTVNISTTEDEEGEDYVFEGYSSKDADNFVAGISGKYKIKVSH